MKLISWNLNGIRAVGKKGLVDILKDHNADVYCFQETKATPDQVKEVLFDLDGYHVHALGAEKKGYSGTAIVSKQEPISVSYHLGIEEHDQEGRVITAEFSEFYLVNVYVPNSKSDLSRLDYRTTWDAALLNHCINLEKKKPVMVCGDLNVAHRPIDLARPKQNYDKSAGFTQKEIDGLDNFVEAGLKDSFRELNPDKVQYSWWSYRGGARQKNVGWRIDYFLVSESFLPNLKKAEILDHVMGSDHCPVSVEL
jgi:exodeoxyribonuclease-3